MRSREEVLLKLDELRHLKRFVNILEFKNLRTNIDDWIAALEWVLNEEADAQEQQGEGHAPE
ncbi:hypothetical protein [Candidatus Pyrohabitans sp.]